MRTVHSGVGRQRRQSQDRCKHLTLRERQASDWLKRLPIYAHLASGSQLWRQLRSNLFLAQRFPLFECRAHESCERVKCKAIRLLQISYRMCLQTAHTMPRAPLSHQDLIIGALEHAAAPHREK